jgi:ubiquitin-conjugating enzyme E2 J2
MPEAPTPQCRKRLERELLMMRTNPTEGFTTVPDPNNILDWYYVFEGPKDTPYAGGRYLGLLRFPPKYPFAPPMIKMLTPNGRFVPNTRLCLSISDYHPETWNPIWNVGSILIGLLSFFVVDEPASGTEQNKKETTPERRMELAALSHSFNANHEMFKALFPEQYSHAIMMIGAKKS